MKFKLKIINALSFFFAAGTPFFGSWKISGHTFGNLHQITVLALAIYFFAGPSFLKLNPGRNLKLIYSKYFFAFTLLILVSLIFSGNITPVGMQQLISYFELAIVYIVFCGIIFHESTITALYYGILFGFSVSVFIGFMQFFKVPGFNLFKDDDLNGNTSYVSQTDAVDVLRIWGPFGNALTFSLYLSVAGTLLFHFFRFVRKANFIAWSIFAMTIIMIGLTVSRMALFAFIICVALVHFFSITSRKKVWFLLLIGSIFIIATVYIKDLSTSNAILSRINASQDDFKGGRLSLWEVGYKVWMNDKIFFGTGPGNLNSELYNNGWKFIGKDLVDSTPGHVENYYLTILYTFGLIPFLFYFMFLVKYVQASYSLLLAGLKTRELVEAVPLFGALICLLINNLINPSLNTDVRIQLVLILQMAICSTLYKKYSLLSIEYAEPIPLLNPYI